LVTLWLLVSSLVFYVFYLKDFFSPIDTRPAEAPKELSDWKTLYNSDVFNAPEKEVPFEGVSQYFSYPTSASSPEVSLKLLSLQPRVYLFQNLLADWETDVIIEIANKRLEPSKVALRKGDKEEDFKSVRTSSQTWLSDADDKVVAILSKKMLRILSSSPSVSNQKNFETEPFQILRYDIGQLYQAHVDYFDPNYYKDVTSHRFATFFAYLSDPEEGGETNFPRANGGPPPTDYSKCDRGLIVSPKKGNAVLWYNMLPNGSFDPFSLHAGCAVKLGQKWAATKWFHITLDKK